MTSKALLSNISQHMDRFVPRIDKEFEYAFTKEMPECNGKVYSFEGGDAMTDVP